MSKNISYNPADKRRRPYLVSCDWLSVSVRLTPLADYTQERMPSGYLVRQKGYGTKQWQHIAEVYEADETPVGTLAWLPRRAGISPLAGIFKVDNQVLYEQGAWDRICAALIALGLKFVGISRLDLACDFNEFFNGLQAQTLINGYLSGDYVKVGLNKAYAFIEPGTHTTTKSDDEFSVYDRIPNYEGTKQRERDEKFIAERNAEIADSGLPLLDFKQAVKLRKPKPAEVQSLTFGKASNPVQVILYNKSKELREVKMKRYIVECWKRAGLDLSRSVWRVEMRLRSEATNLENLCNGEIQSLSLVDVVSQQQFEAIFAAYAEKYFKWYRFDGHDKIQNSPRQQVFSFDSEPVFRPKRRKVKKDASKYLRGVVSQLDKAVFQNVRQGNNLMALHCKRVRDFFADSFDGLSAIRDHDAKQKFLAGHVGQPSDASKHTSLLFDGYDAERAIAIGAEVTEARRRLQRSEGLIAQYIRTQQRTILDDYSTPPVDPGVVESIQQAIINSIFTSSKNIDYD